MKKMLREKIHDKLVLTVMHNPSSILKQELEKLADWLVNLIDEAEGSNRWVKDVAKTSGPKIQNSEVFTSIFTNNYIQSPQCALELGLAIMMDKPIVIVAIDDQQIPKHLTKIASCIERVKSNDKDGMDRAMASIHKSIQSLNA